VTGHIDQQSQSDPTKVLSAVNSPLSTSEFGSVFLSLRILLQFLASQRKYQAIEKEVVLLFFTKSIGSAMALGFAAVVLHEIVMSAKNLSPKSLSPAARRQLPEIAQVDRDRLITANDFRKLQDQFRSSLKSAQRDHHEFFRQFHPDTNLDIYEPNGIYGAVKQLCGADGDLKTVLADLDRAKRLYVLRVSVIHYGSLVSVDAVRKLAHSIRADFLRLPTGQLAELRAKIETLAENKCARNEVETFWFEAVVPFLKTVEPNRFGAAEDDIWKPMGDSISACGMLANLIWPAEPGEPNITETQLMILHALLAREAFSCNTRLAIKLIALQMNKRYIQSASLKQEVATLKQLGLVDTKRGSGGGVWLTQVGQIRLGGDSV
jgi:hypothetical protein